MCAVSAEAAGLLNTAGTPPPREAALATHSARKDASVSIVEHLFCNACLHEAVGVHYVYCTEMCCKTQLAKCTATVLQHHSMGVLGNSRQWLVAPVARLRRQRIGQQW